jgi:hypothetical protein
MIIGIHGYKGSGKNTLAEYLGKELYKKGFKIIPESFAYPIKAANDILFGFSKEQRELKEEVDPRWGISPRWADQQLGTEFGRNIDPDIWVKRLWERIEEYKDLDPFKISTVIVSDLRFRNEAEFIRSKDGLLIYVYGHDYFEHGDPHQSENDLKGWEDWDYKIPNTGSLDDLYTYATILSTNILDLYETNNHGIIDVDISDTRLGIIDKSNKYRNRSN